MGHLSVRRGGNLEPGAADVTEAFSGFQFGPNATHGTIELRSGCFDGVLPVPNEALDYRKASPLEWQAESFGQHLLSDVANARLEEHCPITWNYVRLTTA